MAEALQLSEFLSEASARPWVWNEWDCCYWLGAWIAERHPDKDLRPTWRGRYRTALGCARAVRAAGGLVAVLQALAVQGGFRRVKRPRPGDVGVIRALDAKGREVEIGAIWTGSAWAFLIESGGIRVSAAQAVAVWRI